MNTNITFNVNINYESIFDEFIKKQSIWRDQQILLDKLEILFPSPEHHFTSDEKFEKILADWRQIKVTKQNKTK